MALAWQGVTVADQTRAFGPPALIAPPPQRLGIADSSDGHLPPDAQRQFCHGRALSLLLAARLCQPTALVNVSTGAEATGGNNRTAGAAGPTSAETSPPPCRIQTFAGRRHSSSLCQCVQWNRANSSCS